MSIFEPVRQVADAVLLEGYVLYPYRASSPKNQARWAFGVLAPEGSPRARGGEPSFMQAECVVAPGGRCRVTVRLRFLHIQRRIVERRVARDAFEPVDRLEIDGRLWLPFDEGEVREVDLGPIEVGPVAVGHAEAVDLDTVDPGVLDPDVGGAGSEDAEERTTTRRFEIAGTGAQNHLRNGDGDVIGRLTRYGETLRGRITVTVAAADTTGALARMRLRVDNLTQGLALGAPRGDALPSCLIATHLMLAANGGRFVSLLAPPDDARHATEACENGRWFPVLAGDPGRNDLMLVSPVILYDHPQIADEHPEARVSEPEVDATVLSARAREDERALSAASAVASMVPGEPSLG